jgi:hypothetical protein
MASKLSKLLIEHGIAARKMSIHGEKRRRSGRSGVEPLLILPSVRDNIQIWDQPFYLKMSP